MGFWDLPHSQKTHWDFACCSSPEVVIWGVIICLPLLSDTLNDILFYTSHCSSLVENKHNKYISFIGFLSCNRYHAVFSLLSNTTTNSWMKNCISENLNKWPMVSRGVPDRAWIYMRICRTQNCALLISVRFDLSRLWRVTVYWLHSFLYWSQAFLL